METRRIQHTRHARAARSVFLFVCSDSDVMSNASPRPRLLPTPTPLLPAPRSADPRPQTCPPVPDAFFFSLTIAAFAWRRESVSFFTSFARSFALSLKRLLVARRGGVLKRGGVAVQVEFVKANNLKPIFNHVFNYLKPVAFQSHGSTEFNLLTTTPPVDDALGV